MIDFHITDSSKAKTFTIILHTGEKDYGCFQFRIHWNKRKMYASYTSAAMQFQNACVNGLSQTGT